MGICISKIEGPFQVHQAATRLNGPLKKMDFHANFQTDWCFCYNFQGMVFEFRIGAGSTFKSIKNPYLYVKSLINKHHGLLIRRGHVPRLQEKNIRTAGGGGCGGDEKPNLGWKSWGATLRSL